MNHTLNRVFQISDGLAKIAGNKIKAAIEELKKENVLTAEESKKVLGQMSKAKKNIYDSVARELKKILNQAHKQPTSKKKKA